MWAIPLLPSKFLVAFPEVPPEIGESSKFLYNFPLLRRLGTDKLVPTDRDHRLARDSPCLEASKNPG